MSIIFALNYLLQSLFCHKKFATICNCFFFYFENYEFIFVLQPIPIRIRAIHLMLKHKQLGSTIRLSYIYSTTSNTHV